MKCLQTWQACEVQEDEDISHIMGMYVTSVVVSLLRVQLNT